jgi:hypothetical protein
MKNVRDSDLQFLPVFLFFFLKEVRNATEAHIALMRGSPYVPRTLQMQLMRINKESTVDSMVFKDASRM